MWNRILVLLTHEVILNIFIILMFIKNWMRMVRIYTRCITEFPSFFLRTLPENLRCCFSEYVFRWIYPLPLKILKNCSARFFFANINSTLSDQYGVSYQLDNLQTCIDNMFNPPTNVVHSMFHIRCVFVNFMNIVMKVKSISTWTWWVVVRIRYRILILLNVSLFLRSCNENDTLELFNNNFDFYPIFKCFEINHKIWGHEKNS